MSVSSSKTPGSDLDTTDSAAIRGGTDCTLIGNDGDRLRTSAVITGNATEAEYPTFTCCLRDVAIGNNKSMFSLVNASGSAVKIKIREIKIINVQNVAVTGLVVNFQMFRCGGHSAGSAVTCLPHDTSDYLSGSVTAKTGATIASESTDCLRRWKWSTDEWAQGAQDVESQDHVMQSFLNAYEVNAKTKPLTLNANEGLTLKQTVNSTVGTFDIIVVFTQE